MDINDLIEKLQEEFEDELTIQLTPETNFKELDQWSSMYALIIMALIETEYDVLLSGEDLKKLATVQDLFDLIKQ